MKNEKKLFGVWNIGYLLAKFHIKLTKTGSG